MRRSGRKLLLALAVLGVAAASPLHAAGSAGFIGRDIGTRGDWRSAYGAEGYALPAEATRLPSGVRAALKGHSEWTWENSSIDRRALENEPRTGRRASAWFSKTHFTLELELGDAGPCRLAFYFADWDSLARRQTVEILDRDTGAVLDRQSVSAFYGGEYLVWRVQGNLAVTITHTGFDGSNAVLNGFFLGGAAEPPVTAAPVLELLYPRSALTGQPEFWITARGKNFAPDTVLLWDGSPRPTRVVASDHLRARIPASDIAAAGNRTVRLSGPGGVSSDTRSFAVEPVPAAPVCGISTDLFVSPDGDDAGSGTRERPFKTLERARDAVRTFNGGMHGCITVYLRGGAYALERPLELDSRDSGTNGHYVRYRNYPGESPLVLGGRIVRAWSRVAGTPLWTAHAGKGTRSRQLYVNGTRAVRARSDGGFLSEGPGLTAGRDLGNWKNPTDMEVGTDACWFTLRCPVARVSGSGVALQTQCGIWRTVRLEDTCGAPLQDRWLENAAELVDRPGEWHLDRGSGSITYYPSAGEDLNRDAAVLPVLESLVRLRGSADSPVHHILFEGIAFAYTTWTRPDTAGFLEGQANFTTTADRMLGAVAVAWGRSIVFEKNVFAHYGGVALDLEHVQGVIVRGNHIYDGSGSGIQIGEIRDAAAEPREVTRSNLISDNAVHDIAREYRGGVAIWIGLTQNQWIVHNELYSLPYTGLSVGWAWSPEATIAGDNRVEANFIHDHMLYKNDGGGIYSLGAQPGNIYSANRIENQKGDGGLLYGDEGSRYLSVYDNVLSGTGRSVNLNKAGDSDLHDNWWPFRSADAVSIRQWGARTSGALTFQNNTVITKRESAPGWIETGAGLSPEYSGIKSNRAPLP